MQFSGCHATQCDRFLPPFRIDVLSSRCRSFLTRNAQFYKTVSAEINFTILENFYQENIEWNLWLRVWLLIIYMITIQTRGPGSSVGIATELRAGQSGDRIPVEARFSAPVETDAEAHPAPCKMGIGSFPVARCGRSVTLTPHALLVPRSKIK
jgi:hypothetical protein